MNVFHKITITSNQNKDYVSLTDMVKNTDGDQLIKNWLRNKNTIEYLGIWERLNNPDFNMVEFDLIRNEAGSNRFLMSVNQWVIKTNAIGIIAKSGRYGGTDAHKDIAFEFASWISPEFKLILIKEFQRLKDEEQNRLSGDWDFRRLLVKANYKIHTDAVKEKLVPLLPHFIPEGVVYADEAEVLNYALFGMTSKEWKQQNPQLALENRNIRDYADLHELIVLSNLESANASMINKNVDKKRRLEALREKAISELKSLRDSKYTIAKIQSPYLPKKIDSKVDTTEKKDELGDFDKTVKKFLDTKPPKNTDK